MYTLTAFVRLFGEFLWGVGVDGAAWLCPRRVSHASPILIAKRSTSQACTMHMPGLVGDVVACALLAWLSMLLLSTLCNATLPAPQLMEAWWIHVLEMDCLRTVPCSRIFCRHPRPQAPPSQQVVGQTVAASLPQHHSATLPCSASNTFCHISSSPAALLLRCSAGAGHSGPGGLPSGARQWPASRPDCDGEPPDQ